MLFLHLLPITIPLNSTIFHLPSPLRWFGHGALETQHPTHPFPNLLLHSPLVITLYIHHQHSFTMSIKPNYFRFGETHKQSPLHQSFNTRKHYLGSPNGSLHLGSFPFFPLFTHASLPLSPLTFFFSVAL